MFLPFSITARPDREDEVAAARIFKDRRQLLYLPGVCFTKEETAAVPFFVNKVCLGYYSTIEGVVLS
jgi:hypothetical protein